MLTSAVVCLLAASTALAERSLSMRLAGASSFSGAQDAVVTATLTNTGDETLVLLNDPASVLSDLPTNKFSVSRDDGRVPHFVGALAKYVPEEATSFTTLAPGKSVSVAHSLADAYDFARSGSGEYSIEPTSYGFLVLTENGIEEVFADTIAHTAHFSAGIRARSFVQETFSGPEDDGEDDGDEDEDDGDDDDGDDDDEEVLAPTPGRPRFVGCSAARQNLIITATRGAQRYARNAHAYLRRHNTTSPRYREWFGTFNLSRRKRLRANFRKISARDFSRATYNCQCDRDVYAYVYPGQPGQTWLCKTFWRASPTGTDSKAGTLVHEASHWTATAGTDDVVYGQTRARDLARREPGRAITNADSHEYFAENTPRLA